MINPQQTRMGRVLSRPEETEWSTSTNLKAIYERNPSIDILDYSNPLYLGTVTIETSSVRDSPIGTQH